jgi:Tfp pilus assembly protein PilV
MIFLMELLIAVAVFAICAAVCVSIFVDSYLVSEAADDLNRAMIVAKNGAERLKAGEDLNAPVFYDSGWKPCGESSAVYVLLTSSGRLSVEKATGEEIIAFPVAIGGGGA